MVNRFTLSCYYSRMSEKKRPINGAVVLKQNHKNYNCPVALHFRFKSDAGQSKEGKFLRMHNLMMQHNHPLVVDERKVLLRADIMDEIKIYLQAGLTMPMIVACCNRKFGLEVTYHGFAGPVN